MLEIVPEDPRYTGVLSYRRYRLVNTDPLVDADVTAQVGLQVWRLEHTFCARKLTGAKLLAVIVFLDHLKRDCDTNSISEGAAAVFRTQVGGREDFLYSFRQCTLHHSHVCCLHQDS